MRRIQIPRCCLPAGRRAKKAKKFTLLGGRLPAHPKVEPTEKTRPAKVYPVGEDDIKDYPKYEKMWKEIFGLR